MKQMMMRGLLGSVALAWCACSGSSIDVGPGGAAGNSSVAGSGSVIDAECTKLTPLPVWPESSSSCAAQSDLPLAGVWKGYVENQGAPFDDLTLTIEGASTTAGLCGTLKVGTGTPPPPATNPDIGYPEGVPAQPHAPIVFPGATLTLLEGNTDGARVRFTVSNAETYKGWCELQTSYGPGEDLCGCVPNWGGRANDGHCVLEEPNSSNKMTVDCAKMFLCIFGSGVCTCTAAGCTASPGYSSSGYDLRFDGDQAEGSESQHPGYRVHFTRVLTP